jgi:hypothetical protein
MALLPSCMSACRLTLQLPLAAPPSIGCVVATKVAAARGRGGSAAARRWAVAGGGRRLVGGWVAAGGWLVGWAAGGMAAGSSGKNGQATLPWSLAIFIAGLSFLHNWMSSCQVTTLCVPLFALPPIGCVAAVARKAEAARRGRTRTAAARTTTEHHGALGRLRQAWMVLGGCWVLQPRWVGVRVKICCPSTFDIQPVAWGCVGAHVIKCRTLECCPVGLSLYLSICPAGCLVRFGEAVPTRSLGGGVATACCPWPLLRRLLRASRLCLVRCP